MRQSFSRTAPLTGSVTAAVAASACCIGPLVLAGLGVGGAGFLVVLEPLRPVFTVLTLGLLATGFYLTYRKVPQDDCECESTPVGRGGKAALWMATAIVTGALVFPWVVPSLAQTGPTHAISAHEASFAVSGMTCGSCAVTIRTALARMDGVGPVDVDVAAGIATVGFDPERVSPLDIAQAISATGYEAALLAGGT